MQLILTENWLWGLLNRAACNLKGPSGIANWKGLVVFYKLNTHLSLDSAIPLLVIYLREMQADVHRKTFIWIFTATLFITAQIGKKTLTVYEQETGQTVTIHVMGDSSAIKMNEPLLHTTWMNLRNIILRERS